MDAKLKTALRNLCAGDETAALVTISGVKGSAPRKEGAKMLVFPDGRVFGTIGGGCGEGEVKGAALDALDTLKPLKYTVNMTNDIAEEEGMVCGGIMEVFIDVIPPGPNPAKDLLTAYLDALEAGERPVLATVMGGPKVSGLTETGPTESGVQATGPVGRKLVWTAAGEQAGTVPGQDGLTSQLRVLADQVRVEGKAKKFVLRTEDEGEFEVLLEPSPAPVELLILGAGHIAKPLSAMANLLGYQVTVVDDRPDFANTARFPGAEVICGDFAGTLQKIHITPATFVVIVTRGHRYDQICLEEVIHRPAAYIGMIGSRRRVGALKSQLREAGVAEELLNSLYSPIGLDIAAETPEEIAVGILAEIINVYRGGRAQSLRLKLSSRKGCEV